jgi:hypothetical protein
MVGYLVGDINEAKHLRYEKSYQGYFLCDLTGMENQHSTAEGDNMDTDSATECEEESMPDLTSFLALDDDSVESVSTEYVMGGNPDSETESEDLSLSMQMTGEPDDELKLQYYLLFTKNAFLEGSRKENEQELEQFLSEHAAFTGMCKITRYHIIPALLIRHEMQCFGFTIEDVLKIPSVGKALSYLRFEDAATFVKKFFAEQDLEKIDVTMLIKPNLAAHLKLARDLYNWIKENRGEKMLEENRGNSILVKKFLELHPDGIIGKKKVAEISRRILPPVQSSERAESSQQQSQSQEQDSKSFQMPSPIVQQFGDMQSVAYPIPRGMSGSEFFATINSRRQTQQQMQQQSAVHTQPQPQPQSSSQSQLRQQDEDRFAAGRQERIQRLFYQQVQSQKDFLGSLAVPKKT